MNEVYIYIASYLGVFLLLLFFIQILTNGFLFLFLKVKSSRGKKVLVQVQGKLQHYFVAGKTEGNWLIYRDEEAKRDGRKTFKRLNIVGNPFYRSLNVNCINVDEEKNCIIYPVDLKAIPGYDAIKWSNFLLRAQMKLKLHEDPIILFIILIASILAVIGLGIILVQLNSLSEAVALLQQSSIIQGGNIA